MAQPKSTLRGASWFACAVAIACFGACTASAGRDKESSTNSGGDGGNAGGGGSSDRPVSQDPGVIVANTPPPGTTCAANVNPGRTTIRRLTRDEYDFTVRDLLGDDTRPARAFPDDDNSNADLLTFSTLLLEKLQDSADRLVEAAWARELNGSQPAYARLHVCAPRDADLDCGRQIVKAFARKAFRAPPSTDDLAPYIALVNGGGIEGTKDALKALLASPRFLYRMELDPAGPSLARKLTPHELAARLSYAIRASVPDAALNQLADSGKLLDAGVLQTELARLLRDPKAEALTTSFAARWLSFPSVEKAKPDAAVFPSVTPDLLASMRNETAALVKSLFADEGSLLDLVSTPFTYVDDALARHYQLDGAGTAAAGVRKMVLNGDRKGILSHGSFLLTTSTPVRTSAVKRGKWVLSRLLCMPPPPPPPGVDAEKPDSSNAKTERERLGIHRANPKCASCHNLIDPIGLGLETYDPVGRLRTEVNGVRIDAHGVLPDGRSFDGAGQLADLLRTDRDYAGCVTTQLLTWVLGREPQDAEMCLVGEVADALAAPKAKTSDGLAAIVRSRAFLNRQGDPVAENQ